MATGQGRDPNLGGPADHRTQEEDAALWTEVRKLHRNGFVDLVTEESRYLPRWPYRFARAVGLRKRRTLPDHEYGYRVNLADMHRMQMRFLQTKLLHSAIKLHFNLDNGAGEISRSLESHFRKYVQAIQDHEFMTKYSGHENDPFIVSSERRHDEHLLSYFIGGYGKSTRDLEALKEHAIPTGPWEKNSKYGVRPIGATRSHIRKKGLWSRIVGAFVGGAFLVAPMWLLALRQELYLQLGITTGCVSIFGLLAAWYLSSLEAVFTACIAYAAVLMVFVGAMIQNKGGD
ncbi:uncharacterized protein LDX57_005580 [Aspergillus melleus]|uniref:uncharacterized protein n=1 Tax=Aspergillus melleus TaxID=138277 RepID=UPI001E8DD901|nr:uncharacterized protein LDX57_005580 [Aspergillus melleus]KAH8427875.1 hypothetical protein LDX57_005580 [Aspergillus melleus]